MPNPEIPQKIPYVIDCEPGTYAWCACGKSDNQPFCDGSHQGTDFTPYAYTAEDSKKLFFCGCKRTEGVPLCDGTHNQL